MSIQLDTILTYEIEIDFISENEIVLNFDSGLSVYQNGTRKVTGVKAIDFFDGTNTSVQVDLHNGRARVYVNSTASGGGGAVTSVDGQTGAVVLSSVYQPLNVANLSAIAALTTTAFGRAVLALANAAAFRTYIGTPYVYFDKTTTSQSVTGTTNETILYSKLIPANTFAAGDIIIVSARWSKSGTAGLADNRIRVNTSSSLIGATQIAMSTIAAANSYGAVAREIILETISSQYLLNASANQGSDDLATSSNSTLSIDFSIDQYILFCGDLANSADTHTLKSAYVNFIRS